MAHYPARPRTGLAVFNERYAAILEVAANRVRYLVNDRGQKYVTVADIAFWIVKDLPARYRATFHGQDPLLLKVWRIKTLLSNARFLGAYEAVGIRSVRGQGITLIHKLRAVG